MFAAQHMKQLRQQRLELTAERANRELNYESALSSAYFGTEWVAYGYNGRTNHESVAAAAGYGTLTGGKSLINAAASQGAQFVSLGFWDYQGPLAVTQWDMQHGYGAASIIHNASLGVLVGIGTGGLGKLGSVGRAVQAWDAAGNVASVGRGAISVYNEGGLTLKNSMQLAGGLGGLAGNAASWRSAGASRSIGGSNTLGDLKNVTNFAPGRLQGRNDTCALNALWNALDDMDALPTRFAVGSNLRKTIRAQGGLDQQQIVGLVSSLDDNLWAISQRGLSESQLSNWLSRGSVLSHVDGNHWVRVTNVIEREGHQWARIFDSGVGGSYDQLLTSFMTRRGANMPMVLIGKLE